MMMECMKTRSQCLKRQLIILELRFKIVLIIEDRVSGITNAYKAGCHNIVVVDSANKKEEYEKLSGVVQVIDSFDNFK